MDGGVASVLPHQANGAVRKPRQEAGQSPKSWIQNRFSNSGAPGSVEHPAWTLFGPYVPGRRGPQGNGLQRKISHLELSGARQHARNQLEVLAGAISWGFKSPSPHHILSFAYNNLQASIFGVPILCPNLVHEMVNPCLSGG